MREREKKQRQGLGFAFLAPFMFSVEAKARHAHIATRRTEGLQAYTFGSPSRRLKLGACTETESGKDITLLSIYLFWVFCDPPTPVCFQAGAASSDSGSVSDAGAAIE